MRISKDQYYLGIAYEVSLRSTCLRRQYGAVIVKNDEIISTGYNGAPRGETNCCDAGECWRERNNIPHGSQYEKCVAVHAEQNAIISAARRDMIGSTLYLVGHENGRTISDTAPCEICMRMIKNAGIRKVVTKDDVYDFEEFEYITQEMKRFKERVNQIYINKEMTENLEGFPFYEYEP